MTYMSMTHVLPLCPLLNHFQNVPSYWVCLRIQDATFCIQHYLSNLHGNITIWPECHLKISLGFVERQPECTKNNNVTLLLVYYWCKLSLPLSTHTPINVYASHCRRYSPSQCSAYPPLTAVAQQVRVISGMQLPPFSSKDGEKGWGFLQ